MNFRSHNPPCQVEAECSICQPTNLEKLTLLCSIVEITPLFSSGGGYMIDCYTMHENYEGQMHASADTIEMAALKILKELEYK